MAMSAVYRGCQLVSAPIGTLPIRAYTGTGRARQEVPVPHILLEPHPEIEAAEFWSLLFFDQARWGHFAALNRRDKAGRIRWLEPLPPRNVRPERDPKYITAQNPSGTVYHVSRPQGDQVTLTSYDLFFVPAFGDGLNGISVVGLARQGIALSLAMEEYAARLFQRGTLTGGTVTVAGRLSPARARRIQLDVERRAGGLDNAHRVLVLDQDGKFTRDGLPPGDIEFLAGRRFQISEMARWFGLPPHLLGDLEKSTSWGTGLDTQQRQLLVFTYGPNIIRAEQRMSRITASGITPSFDTGGFLRTDHKSQTEAFAKAVLSGFMKPSEARDELGLPYDELVDDFFMQKQMARVPTAGAPDDNDN